VTEIVVGKGDGINGSGSEYKGRGRLVATTSPRAIASQ